MKKYSSANSVLLIPFILMLVCMSNFVSAHTINYQLQDFSKTEIGWQYIRLGFTHIIPLGFDHILFVLSLFLLNPKLKLVIAQATAFTVAHSITLGLAMYGFIDPPGSVVEPIIALSIVFVALENIFSDKVRSTRLLIIFGFGLIHGMGFASALIELGLPQKDFLLGLISFNVGVELGQITVIIIAYFALAFFFSSKPYYKKYIVTPLSLMIACIAGFWVIERVFFI